MPNRNNPDQETDELSVALSEPTSAITAHLKDLADNTAQWSAYAEQKLAEGDVAEAAAALIMVNKGIAEWQQGSALVAQKNLQLHESLRVVIEQRDHLVEEIEHAHDVIAEKDHELEQKDEVIAEKVDEVEQAREEGRQEGAQDVEDYYMESALDDPEFIEEVVQMDNEDFVNSADYIARKLREMGRVSDADELAAKAGEAMQVREAADDLLSKYRDMVWQAEREAYLKEHPQAANDGLKFEDEDDELDDDTDDLADE